jgi:hypothetical protein
LIGVLIFIFIIWEAITSNRPAIFSYIQPSYIEWLHNYPPMDHTYSELNLITNF